MLWIEMVEKLLKKDTLKYTQKDTHKTLKMVEKTLKMVEKWLKGHSKEHLEGHSSEGAILRRTHPRIVWLPQVRTSR